MVARILLLIALLPLSAGAAEEQISTPLKTSFGIGTGIRAETQYSDPQPTVLPNYALSTDLQWWRFQALLEWSRWSESSMSGNQTNNHRQDNYLLFARYEFLHSDWLGLFGGAGGGFQQDHVDMRIGAKSVSASGDFAFVYGPELGINFHLTEHFEAQLSGRLLSQPHTSGWTQWAGVRISYWVF